MKTRFAFFSISLLLFPLVAYAQDITSWKDPDTGKEYYRCTDEAGRVMLTDSLALCEKMVGKSLEPKSAEPQKASPKPPAKKPRSSAIPLWETVTTLAETTAPGEILYIGPRGERYLIGESGSKVRYQRGNSGNEKR